MDKCKDIDFDAIQHLLKCDSKEAIVSACISISECDRHDDSRVKKHITTISEHIPTINKLEAQQLIVSTKQLFEVCVFDSYTEVAHIQALFPDGFNKNLRDFMSKFILRQIPQWKSDALQNIVTGVPKLVSSTYRIDTAASGALSHPPAPTPPHCVMRLQVSSDADGSGSGKTTFHDVGVSGEVLARTIHSLGRVRQQLDAIANRAAAPASTAT